MKERPILMCGEMVRATLDDLKFQTRRIMKPQPSADWSPHSYGEVHKMKDGAFVMHKGAPVCIGWGPTDCMGEEAYACPYGQPADRLWVRETFCVCPKCDCFLGYRANQELPAVCEFCGQMNRIKWKPSLFMPRSASRLTLEIESVRVERLQDISGKDCIAEGVLGHGGDESRAKTEYMLLWESINGKGSWALNPWVWVIEFKKL